MLWSADGHLLARLLPLALGAAVSPMLLVFQLLTLSSPRRGLSRSLAFLAGCTLVVLLWLGCAGWIASLLPRPGPGPDPIAAAFDALFALLLLSAGGWLLLQPPRPPQRSDTPGLLGPWLTGLTAMGCNLTSLVLFLPAIQDISRSGLRGLAWWVVALFTAVLTLLPAWLPPALVLLAGQRGRRTLEALAGWVMPRQRGINACVVFGLALLLLSRAIWRL
ncbi:MAG: GAP family protein [Cyanobacteriota bacterium]